MIIAIMVVYMSISPDLRSVFIESFVYIQPIVKAKLAKIHKYSVIIYYIDE
jgi:hypothetical protein